MRETFTQLVERPNNVYQCMVCDEEMVRQVKLPSYCPHCHSKVLAAYTPPPVTTGKIDLRG